MSRTYLLAGTLLLAFAAPSFAQPTTTTTTAEYYVVQDSGTKKCTIVEQKPTSATIIQVGPLAFKTMDEAQAGMKTTKVCASE